MKEVLVQEVLLDGATITRELTSFLGSEGWFSALEIVLDIYGA